MWNILRDPAPLTNHILARNESKRSGGYPLLKGLPQKQFFLCESEIYKADQKEFTPNEHFTPTKRFTSASEASKAFATPEPYAKRSRAEEAKVAA